MVGVRNETVPSTFAVGELQPTAQTQPLLSVLSPSTTQTGKVRGQRKGACAHTKWRAFQMGFPGASVYTSVKWDPQCLPLTVVSCPRSRSEGQEHRTQLNGPSPAHSHTASQGAEVWVGGDRPTFRRRSYSRENATLYIVIITVTNMDQVSPSCWTHAGQCRQTCLDMHENHPDAH